MNGLRRTTTVDQLPSTDARALASLATFIAVTFGSAWLLALPLWLGKGISDPLFPFVAVAVMFTPALGSLVAMTLVERRRDVLRGWGMWPIVRPGRWFLYLGLGLVIPVLLVLAALVTGSWLGQYPADFLGAGGLMDIIEQQSVDVGMIPVWILVASQFVSIAVGAFINTIPALGEEVGWRGWLVPRLMAWGAVPTIAVSGVLWALWHAPLILLGYNYPTAPGWTGLLMMTGMCTLVGGILAWLRIRSESVWPAALAHGSLNASVGLSSVFATSGSTVDTVHATILGWSGWMLPFAVIAVLLATGQFRTPRTRPIATR
ncbi:CPBP family intramembrane glutamic endopeptidase [Microbacterium sp.]|uniref:CPBP family intramembrane glutamic endopeptidase n=1 Tax=Microbacterium sp. TaxID=51671 RepID=UPI0028124C99|nr:CPBP family intramembrane glutamic endopeptidase [Microbacterium sp.]